ncbi:hypothetical protein ES703_32699 [subsurface metagenome]
MPKKRKTLTNGIRLIRIVSSTLLVVGVFICLIYGVPYFLIKYPGIPSVIRVAGMVAFIGGLIALAAVAAEQRRTI